MMDKKRGRKNTPECHLREGQTALAAALGALDDPEICLEDRSLDPALLVQALDHYRQAEAGFAAAVLPNLEAQALLGQAEVLLRMSMNAPSSREHLTHAEQSARKALERLDSVQDLAHALRGYLLLAETSRYLAMGGPPFEQEAGLRQLQALLDSTEYLAQEYGDPLLMARASAEACRVMSERFEMERDENLLDAIRYGERAIALLRKLPGTRSFELPSLLHHLGNCCLKVGGERSRWLTQGRDWYREGAAAVDARRYPRLHRTLNEHAAMAETLLDHSDYSLPEREMVARYANSIQVAMQNQEVVNARSRSWGFLAWAWSLPKTPNVHIGEAHKALAKVAMSASDWEDAQHHLYHSIGVLSAVLSERDNWFHLVADARDLFVKALRNNGQGAALELWLGRAAQAFVVSEAACMRGSMLIDQDRIAALPEFEHALTVFPCHPAAHFYRGVLRMLDENLAGAVSDFDFTITLNPKSLRAHMNRASIKLRLGDHDGARADLDQAVEIDPHNVDVRRMRAGLHEQHGEREKAVYDLESALKNISDPNLKAAVEQQLSALRAA